MYNISKSTVSTFCFAALENSSGTAQYTTVLEWRVVLLECQVEGTLNWTELFEVLGDTTDEMKGEAKCQWSHSLICWL